MLKLASILVRDLGNLGFTVQLHFRSLQLDCFDLKWEEILDHWLGQKDRGSKSVFADVDVDTGARLNSWSKKGKKPEQVPGFRREKMATSEMLQKML